MRCQVPRTDYSPYVGLGPQAGNMGASAGERSQTVWCKVEKLTIRCALTEY